MAIVVGSGQGSESGEVVWVQGHLNCEWRGVIVFTTRHRRSRLVAAMSIL